MAITNTNLPKSQQTGAAVQAESDGYYPNVVARPLQMPDFCEMKPKNPLLSARWCNRVAGDGQRLDQVTYAGFRPAKPEEVYIPGPRGAQVPTPVSMVRDGKVIFGDLMLMLIDKASYDGALKYNRDRAIQRMAPNNAKKTGDLELSKAMKEAGVGTNALKGKLSTFQPTDSEIEAGEKASK